MDFSRCLCRSVAVAIGSLLCMAGHARTVLWEEGDFKGAHGVRFADGVMTIPHPGGGLTRKFALKPEWRSVRLCGEIRVTDVPRAKESWQNGRFAMRWVGDGGRTVQPWPNSFGRSGTTGWTAVDQENPIPPGAKEFELALCNLSTGGVVEFRNVSVSVEYDGTSRPGNAEPPAGVPADIESIEDAWRVETPARTRISLNGLWKCRPVFVGDAPCVVPGPDDNWCWERVPDVWPLDRRPFRASARPAPYVIDHRPLFESIVPDRAWYSRAFRMPAAADRAVLLTFDLVSSHAAVYLDGKRAGEVSFPGGTVDLTPLARPGETQTLALDMDAAGGGNTLDYNESTRADRRKAVVKCAGVTGDLWLELVPRGVRVHEAYVETSVAKGEIAFVATGLADGEYLFEAEVASVVGGGEKKTFSGRAESTGDGRLRFVAPWADAKRWDVDTPQNRYVCRLVVKTADGRIVDAPPPFEFGFREVQLAGRDLLLNGTPFHIRALYNGSAQKAGPDQSKANALALCRNLKAHGFNLLIAGNYSFAPGDVGYLQGLLEACDETGMLYSFSLPHLKDFGDLSRNEVQARYREVAAKAIALARNHPSVVTWALNHNSAGYLGAGHPQRIDGKYELPESQWRRNRPYARITRRIVGELDPTRPCYHHESGNLDDFHTVNCYLDWAPVQERSDWLEHWATEGVKPLFFVEWGLPHISNWSSYRGPLFIWRKPAYQSLWANEYAAAFFGDVAYRDTSEAARAIEREERLWAQGRPFAWSELNSACREQTENYLGVQALYAADNWRSLRGWGITAMLPWDQEGFFRQVAWPGRAGDPEGYAKLKRPGYSSLGTDVQWGDPAVWELTSVGRTMDRWNRDECAWIAGDGVFTDKRHLFRPGERVTKTLMILNDRRRPAEVSWRTDGAGSGKVTVAAGGHARVPVVFTVPRARGDYTLRAEFDFGGGVRQSDEFAYSVVPSASVSGEVFAIDPKGATRANLERLGFTVREGVPEKAAGSTLVVGRESLTRGMLDATLVPFAKGGGRVVVFEQTKATLEECGFRVQTYGLRRAFRRFRTEPYEVLLGADDASPLLRDWAGASTLVEPYTPLKDDEVTAASDTWAGFAVTRVWRNGNRGAVATVIPEKPAVGDWCALVDGGFDLQYAPLLEWRLGEGSVTFCQLDVTGRTEADVAADELVKTLVGAAHPKSPRTCIAKPYGFRAFESALNARDDWFVEPDPEKDSRRLYYVSSGAGAPPPGFFEAVTNGATALLCGLSAAEVRAWCPAPVEVTDAKGRHFRRIDRLPAELNGLSNADWAWHGAMDFAAFGGEDAQGNEAFRIVRCGKGRLVFWQVPPWAIDAEARPYLRTSKRRAWCMLSRLMGNLGFRRGPDRVLYADVPVVTDDPYRYFHW